MGHVFSLSNLIKAYRYLKKNGAAAAFLAVQEQDTAGWEERLEVSEA